jgi:hypothetical protein
MYVCMYVCMYYVCIYVCMYVCMNSCITYSHSLTHCHSLAWRQYAVHDHLSGRALFHTRQPKQVLGIALAADRSIETVRVPIVTVRVRIVTVRVPIETFRVPIAPIV